MENNGLEKRSSSTAEDDIQTILILLWNAQTRQSIKWSTATRNCIDERLIHESHNVDRQGKGKRDMKKKEERHVGFF